MEVLRSAAIALNPGRYMSIDNGPIAVRRPRMRISSLLLDGEGFMKGRMYEKLMDRAMNNLPLNLSFKKRN